MKSKRAQTHLDIYRRTFYNAQVCGSPIEAIGFIEACEAVELAELDFGTELDAAIARGVKARIAPSVQILRIVKKKLLLNLCERNDRDLETAFLILKNIINDLEQSIKQTYYDYQ